MTTREGHPRKPALKRPFRTVVDPSHDGADIGFAVIDRLRAEMLNRTGLSELLTVRHPG